MQFILKIPKPFNFPATLKTHGWFQLPPFYWQADAQTLNWVMRLNSQPSLVQLRSVDETKNTTLVEFSGDFDESAKSLIEKKFRHIMNLDLDLTEYYHICQKDKILCTVPERGMGRLMRAESLWEDVFKSICGTNVQWKQAVKMIHNIASIGETAPGTDYHVFPGPEHILDRGEMFLKETGRVGYRSSYLIDLAKRFVAGEPMAEQAEKGELSTEELKKYFLGFKGIGPTTARYLMALYGSFSEMAIDSLVMKYMTDRHFNGRTPTHQEISEFYQRFGRWRYLAYWM